MFERKQAKRLAIVLFLLLAIPIAGTCAYLVITLRIDITVEECITVDRDTVPVKLHPKETVIVAFIISNAADVDMETNYVITTSDPLVTTAPPNGQIVVPATGSYVLSITVHADRGIHPGTFDVKIALDRPPE